MQRRRFLGHSTLAAGGAFLASSLSIRNAVGANERIRVGLIGCGGMGGGDLKTFFMNPEVECPVVCDVDDKKIADKIELVQEKRGNTPDGVKDFRRVIERDDLDAVLIATPDHWHALPTVYACEAGKDVYVEKPLATSVAEGRAMLEAAKRNERVVQMGTQWRSGEHYREAVEIVQSGKLGKIRLVRAWAYLDWVGGIGNPADCNPPEGVDYDMWLGPAPERPFNPNRFHFNFRWYWDYAGGLMTDWGVHLINLVMWAMGLEHPKTVYCSGGKYVVDDNTETPDTQLTVYDFPNYTFIWEHQMLGGVGIGGRPHGISFSGSEATLILDADGWEILPEKKKDIAAEKGEPGPDARPAHVRNFLDCMRSRKPPVENLDLGAFRFIYRASRQCGATVRRTDRVGPEKGTHCQKSKSGPASESEIPQTLEITVLSVVIFFCCRRFVMDRRVFMASALVCGGCATLPQSVSEKSVVDFGAVGNGENDDTAAIQAAVDSKAGGVYFSKGVYRISKPITVDFTKVGWTSILGNGATKIIMAGPGPAFHLIGTHHESADPRYVKEEVWQNERMPHISGFEIQGEHPESEGILAEKTMQPIFTNLLINKCKIGIHFITCNRNIIITNCHIYNNDEYGLFLDNVDLHQAVFSNNHISFNKKAGICTIGGFINNLQIVSNNIEYNFDVDHFKEKKNTADILMDLQPKKSLCIQGSIVGNTIQSIYQAPGGANIRIIGADRVGGMFAISGNLIGNRENGIHLVKCRGVSVSGNMMYSHMNYSFNIEECGNIVIGDNAMDYNSSRKKKSTQDTIKINKCKGVSLNGIILEDNVQYNKDSDYAIDIEDSEDVSIGNCQVLDPTYRGIKIRDSKRCKVVNSTIFDRREKVSLVSAIDILGQSRDTLISGNTINENAIHADPGTAVIKDNLEIKATA